MCVRACTRAQAEEGITGARGGRGRSGRQMVIWGRMGASSSVRMAGGYTYDHCWIDRHRCRFFLVDPRTRSQISVMVSHGSRHGCLLRHGVGACGDGLLVSRRGSASGVVCCGLVVLGPWVIERRWKATKKASTRAC